MLQAKVEAVNLANRYANEIHPILSAAVTPFVGQQVLKVDQFLAKVKKVIPELACTVPLHVYRNTSDYSLSWTVKTCVSDGRGHAVYHETTVYVGELRNGVLTQLSSFEKLREDYTAEEVERLRAAYREAKSVADKAHSALHPFGEYDR